MGNRLPSLSSFPSRTVRVTGPALPDAFGQPLLVFSRLTGEPYELELRTPDAARIAQRVVANPDLASTRAARAWRSALPNTANS